jgi:DNA repair exonuclease SbcCD nuclease subunit
MKLLQFSDLHLSSTNEPEYCLNVLQEIIDKAIHLKVEALLLCGDIFDTYADLVSLRTKFLEILKPFDGFIYFLPGNHESLRRTGKETGFQIFDWGDKVKVLDESPFQLQKISEAVELLSIPHRESYGDLLLSLPEAKSAQVRIAIAHATIVGMSFTGFKDEEEEEKSGYIDVSQLQALECDYVAVGHIHSARSQKFGNMEVCYAGSARVWRMGEMGSRKGILLNIKEGVINKTDVILERAGIYAEVLVQLGLNGLPDRTADEYLSSYTRFDWVRIHWTGMVESMNGKKEFQKKLESEWKSKLRRLEFDSDESQVLVVENLLENTFVQNFVKMMDSKKDSMESSEWIRTKELGLKLLLEVGK